MSHDVLDNTTHNSTMTPFEVLSKNSSNIFADEIYSLDYIRSWKKSTV